MGASLSSLSAGDEDAAWLALSLSDVSNDALVGNLAKTLPAAIAGEEADTKSKGGPDAAYQTLHALSELLGSGEAAGASAKASPLVGGPLARGAAPIPQRTPWALPFLGGVGARGLCTPLPASPAGVPA
jgi:hypothetical protein